jgi:copper chaperone CopZ
METTIFSAPDIECGGCAASIEKALNGVSGLFSLTVDIEAKAITATHDPALLSVEAILTRLDHLGFPATEQK